MFVCFYHASRNGQRDNRKCKRYCKDNAHKNAAALFSANALPRQLQTLHFCLRSDSGFPPAVRFAADYTPYCKLKTLRTAFSVPYNNVRRARLHILCVENTPPKNKKQPNKRLPFLGSFPQQSSAIQNSRTIAVISRTDAAAITIPENTQRQTKFVFGVVRTYFSVTFPCSKSFFKSGEI